MSPPPTSIDGTDIVGATIDGETIGEISIDGQTVFRADFDVGGGKFMLSTSRSTDEAELYELSTAWDIQTATLTSTGGVSNPDPRGCYLTPNGNKIIIHSLNDLEEYDTGSSFDVSSLNLVRETGDFPTGGDLDFRLNGSAFIQVEEQNNVLTEFTVNTPFTLDGATQVDTFSPSITAVHGISFADEGNKLYIVSNTTQNIERLDLATPFDLSSASSNGTDTLPTGQDVRGLAMKDDGTTFIMADREANTIRQYDFGTPFDISTISERTTIPANTGDSLGLSVTKFIE